jgi:DNA-binding CsgD family transcriptional regulator
LAAGGATDAALRPHSAGDFTRFQRAILALHSHRDLDSLRRAVPGIFLEVIRADYFSLQDARIDFVKRTVRVLNIWESRPLRVGARLEATERTLLDHPFLHHAVKHGLERALMLSDFMTLPQLRRSRLYREALQPVNIGRMLSVGSLSGPGLATLTLARPETAPDFTERDRRMLEMLRPHFDQARTNLERETLRRANRSQSLNASGLTPRETGVALWLAQGKTNPEIASILAAPVRTIEKHVERILRKLGVENRAAAALAVARIVRA